MPQHRPMKPDRNHRNRPRNPGPIKTMDCRPTVPGNRNEGDEKYVVEEGDYLHFNSTVPHKVVAADENQKVKFLSVLSL